jgi:hypothetical protein
LADGLPYGASKLHDTQASTRVLGGGVLLMAVGATVFAVGWRFKINSLEAFAFVLTLIGWMALVIGFAFWFVTTVAKKFGKTPAWEGGQPAKRLSR